MALEFDDNAAQRVAEGMRSGIERAAIHLEGKIKNDYLSGSPLGVQTGQLRRSVTHTATTLSGSRASSDVGTNVVYARVHEYGGTITAKGGGLTVPIGAEGRRAARSSGGNIRSLGLTLVKRKGKPPLLVKKGSRGSIRPLFVLLKSVRIPMRPFMRPALEREAEELKRIVSDEIKKAVGI